jgi:hypothetical protein
VPLCDASVPRACSHLASESTCASCAQVDRCACCHAAMLAAQGEECLLTISDRQPDRCATIEYYRVRRAPSMISLEDWFDRQHTHREGNSGAGAEGADGAPPEGGQPPEPWELHRMTYDDFHLCFEKMDIADMVRTACVPCASACRIDVKSESCCASHGFLPAQRHMHCAGTLHTQHRRVIGHMHTRGRCVCSLAGRA